MSDKSLSQGDSWEEEDSGDAYNSDYERRRVPEIKEKPIFSAQSHVYQMDFKARRSPWIQLSPELVVVHFYNDMARGLYRVLCVDGSKLLINCTLTTSIVLKKTSAKFAQWLDSRWKTVYGFGFNNEAETDYFVTKFQELQSKVSAGSSNIPPDVAFSGASEPSAQKGHSDPLPSLSELEKLKGALAESSMAAKRWETELQKLSNQNAELKAYLDAMMAIHKGNRCPLAHAGATGTADGSEPVQLTGHDYGQGFRQTHPVTPQRQRSSADEKMGNDGSSAISQQLQTIVDEHKTAQRRLHSHEASQGLGNENRQLILHLQKLIGDKLTEALTLHKLMTRLL